MTKFRVWALTGALSLAIALFMTACYQYHDDTYLDELDISLTYYDTSFNFQQYDTYAVRDSVGLIEDHMKPNEIEDFYKPGGTSDKIKAYVRNHFNSLGYTEVANDENPDFGVNLVVASIENTYVYGYPGWWYGYSDYYYYYWWGWYPYYGYPWYYTTVSYQTGSLLIEMVDGQSLRDYRLWADDKSQNEIEHADPDEVPDVLFRWQAIVSGVAGSSADYNKDRAERGIDEVFTQSPYLGK